MAEEMLGVESLPQEIAAFLLRKSEGSPLYCEESMSFLDTPQTLPRHFLGNPLYCEEIMCFLLHQRLVVAARIGPDGPRPPPMRRRRPTPTGGVLHSLTDEGVGSLVPEAEEADSVQELLHERVDSFRSARPLAASAGGGRRRGTVMLAKGASLSSLESAFGSADSVAGQSHTLQRLLTAQVSR